MKTVNKIIIVLICFTISSCSENKNKTSIQNPKNGSIKISSKKQLDEYLKVGMSKDEVLKLLGKPTTSGGTKAYSFIVYFQVPFTVDELSKSQEIGFSIDFKNDKVHYWRMIRGDGIDPNKKP